MLDLPGHGQSTKAIGDGSVDALAQSVLAFMHALGVDAAHLVGHSLGGAVAIACALAAPSRVSSLSLLAPAGIGADINGDYLRGFISAGSRRDLKPLLQQLVANPDLVNRQMIDDTLKFKRLDGVDNALTTIAAALVDGNTQRISLREPLAGLQCPVQIVWGRADRIVPVAQADGLPAAIAVHVIDGAGHLPHLEAANVVNGLLTAFIGAHA